MNTTIYLVRHSEPFKIHRGIEEVEEDISLGFRPSCKVVFLN